VVDRRELLRQEYVARINHVADYIHTHFNGDPRLDALAKATSFSSYRFHQLPLPSFAPRYTTGSGFCRSTARPRYSQFKSQAGFIGGLEEARAQCHLSVLERSQR
jgi:hypothetical protein